jgi:hypothetical protein
MGLPCVRESFVSLELSLRRKVDKKAHLDRTGAPEVVDADLRRHDEEGSFVPGGCAFQEPRIRSRHKADLQLREVVLAEFAGVGVCGGALSFQDA